MVLLLVSVNANLPRYFLAHSATAREVGILSALSYVAIAANTLVMALGQAAGPGLARLFVNREILPFLRLAASLFALAAGLGLAGLAAASLWGRPLIEVLYGREYARETASLAWLMLAGAIGYLSSSAGYVMSAVRSFRAQVPILAGASVSTAAACHSLVGSEGVAGAAMAQAIGYSVQLVLSVAWLFLVCAGQFLAVPEDPIARRMEVLLKRALDVACSLAGLALCAPLLAGIALVIRCTSGAPVLFRQARLGKNGVPFRVCKFRTMAVGAADLRNGDGSSVTVGDDPRVTRVGRWLRDTSLDELPQLWNVLVGEMSLVGPRPDQVDQLRFYRDGEHKKLLVKPGITGLAQISGRNRIRWEERKRLDIEYVEMWSWRLDLRILARTIPYVLFRQDIHEEGKHGGRTSSGDRSGTESHGL
jgi:lipopolysaccharide/colanic/teichoic acid biosynthesis glycosyltransferase